MVIPPNPPSLRAERAGKVKNMKTWHQWILDHSTDVRLNIVKVELNEEVDEYEN
jgi:hypothetical protein